MQHVENLEGGKKTDRVLLILINSGEGRNRLDNNSGQESNVKSGQYKHINIRAQIQ